MNDLRTLPSIETILNEAECGKLVAEFGHNLTVEAARHVLDDMRNEKVMFSSEKPAIISTIRKILTKWTMPTLSPVINASGVILHTNLGRAPISLEALYRVRETSIGYSSLEFDLDKGTRGSRHDHLNQVLTQLTHAEAALVVNNNAAAVLLVLTSLGNRKKAIISRSQLVEIGGGFRIPDVMRQSGVKLIEVGTTNQVHLDDYEDKLIEGAKIVVRAHSSNFKIIGYTSEPELIDLVELAHRYGAIFIDDLGSGALLDTKEFGLSHEPMVQESISAGVDVICFSGDKLLGGPQAGIILGKKILLDKVKRHPLARAVRADKLCLSALHATVIDYLRGTALSDIPVWSMISKSATDIQKKAEEWQTELGFGRITSGFSTVGGGSLPGDTLPTWLLTIKPKNPQKCMKRLRSADPPVIGRIDHDELVLDPRTIFAEQENELIATIRLMKTEGYFEY